MAVERDASAGRVVEPDEQRRDGRLARPGRADERERLAGMDLEVEPAQHGLVGSRVREVHVVEAHLAARVRERRRVRTVGDERLGVEHLPHPAGRGLGLLGHREDPGQLLDREHEDQEVRHERDQAADGQVARPTPRTRRRGAPRASVRFGIRPSTQMNCVWMRTRSSSVSRSSAAAGVVAVEHLVAPAERLEHADAARRLLEHRREVAGLVLDVAHDDVVVALEAAAQQSTGIAVSNREQSEPHVEVQEQREDRDHLDRR